MKVKGLDQVLKAFQKQVDLTATGARKGLQDAGKKLKPIITEVTPMDENNLRPSLFYSTDVDSKIGARMRIGFTEYYAPFVHEMPESNNWTTAGTGPKFLERPLFQNFQLITESVVRNTKV